jgi:hypothetical protein
MCTNSFCVRWHCYQTTTVEEVIRLFTVHIITTGSRTFDFINFIQRNSGVPWSGSGSGSRLEVSLPQNAGDIHQARHHQFFSRVVLELAALCMCVAPTNISPYTENKLHHCRTFKIAPLPCYPLPTVLLQNLHTGLEEQSIINSVQKLPTRFECPICSAPS